MPRRARISFAGGLYHVVARGNRRQRICLDDHDRHVFLARLSEVTGALAWRVYAYCLMPNHYHAVVETPADDLSLGMQRLNGGYAAWFNRRHDLDGHVFQGRFYSGLVESDWHLVELTRYLSLNPVRAGLCPTPRDWAWSSFRAIVGLSAPPSFLAVDQVLSRFGRDPRRARELFHRFVHDAPPRLDP